MRRSIASNTLWFTCLTLSLVLLTIAATYFALSHQVRSRFNERLATDCDTYAYALETHIAFYRSLLKELAGRRTVSDLLEFPASDDAFAWAESYRRLLPGSIGFALFTADGRVLGNARALYVGPACSEDIQRLAQGDPVISPAVHRDLPALEHFDLIEPVVDDSGRTSGYIFASFSLNGLSNFAASLLRDGQSMALYDANRKLIFSVGASATQHGSRHEVQRPLSLGQWDMHVDSQMSFSAYTVSTLGAAATLLAVLIGGGVIILSRRISSGLVNELKTVQVALEDIAGDKPGTPDIRSGFRETQPVMEAVREISCRTRRQTSALRELSRTDELTGLMNRRGWASELNRLWALAGRDTGVMIMALDLDIFKGINNRCGQLAGDKLLRQFADCLKACTRQADCVARIGGEKFILALINSDPGSARDFLARLRECFERAQTGDRVSGLSGRAECTLRAGLIQLRPGRDADVDAAMQRVDTALNLARQNVNNGLYSDPA
jgi:diguanylate cyclase (GGDEF)-like protein